MKKILITAISFIALSCGSTKLVTTSPTNAAETASPSSSSATGNSAIGGPDGLKAAVDKIAGLPFTNAEIIGTHMNYLASDDLKGRDTGSEGIELAAKYLEQQFELMGIAPYFSSYRDTLSNFKKPAYNIVGLVEGNDTQLKKEYLLIGAHYDHIGTITPVGGDFIANGANDNASGTTTVVELARYFGKNRTNKRSIIFVLFSAEEKGLLGSRHLAEKLKAANLNLYAMLNFEMTGVPMQGMDFLLYITGYNRSNLAEISNQYVDEKLIGYLPTAKNYSLFQRSDNYPFYDVFGVPSHTYCSFDFTNFNYYHKPGDENKEMDFEHMAKVVNKMIPVLEGIANAPTQEISSN